VYGFTLYTTKNRDPVKVHVEEDSQSRFIEFVMQVLKCVTKL